MRPAFDRSVAARDSSALLEHRLEASSILLQLYSAFRQHRVRPGLRLWLQGGLYSTLEVVADADEALCSIVRGRGGAEGGFGGEESTTAAAAAAAAAAGGGGSSSSSSSDGATPEGASSSISLVADDDAAAASVAACLAAIEATSPGSDLHVQLAARAVAVARRRLLTAQQQQRNCSGGDGGGATEEEAAAALAAAELRCAHAHVLRYGGGWVGEDLERLVGLSEQLGLSWLHGEAASA